MGMPAIQRRRFQIEILTDTYLATGELEPIGPFMLYLNDASRPTFVLKGVVLTAIDPANLTGIVKMEELQVFKKHVVAIRLPDASTRNTLPLMPKREMFRIITKHYAIQATFACGPDTPVYELFESIHGDWAPCIDAHVHPLQHVKHAIFQAAPNLTINKQAILFAQPIGKPPTA